jgi:hypothetical protein
VHAVPVQTHVRGLGHGQLDGAHQLEGTAGLRLLRRPAPITAGRAEAGGQRQRQGERPLPPHCHRLGLLPLVAPGVGVVRKTQLALPSGTRAADTLRVWTPKVTSSMTSPAVV